MSQDNLPRLPDHHRRYWYCPHNPAGDRRESGTYRHPTGDTPILEVHEAPGAADHIDPRYCFHCPAPTHCIPLLTYDLPTPHPTAQAQTTATNSPPRVQDALLPTFPPHVHPRMRHPHSHDTATDHSSSFSSKHQHCTSLSWEQGDNGITVSDAYWPEGNRPLTDMPGKSEIHMSSRLLERQHVGAGDSFLELSETTVTEKAWRMLHQLLDTLCL